MIEKTNMVELLNHHFALNKFEIDELQERGHIHVRISLKVGEYNDFFLWYRWDYLCSRINPTLHHGSWTCTKTTDNGFDHFDFELIFPPASIEELYQ